VFPLEDLIAHGSSENYLVDEPTRHRFVESALDSFQELYTGKQWTREIVKALFEENTNCVFSLRNSKLAKILSPYS